MKDRVEEPGNTTLLLTLPDISNNNYTWTTVTTRGDRSSYPSGGELNKARSKSNTRPPHPGREHRERGSEPGNRKLYVVTNKLDTQPQNTRREHQHNHKYHSGNESRNNGRFHKSNDKFALSWAKVRADNGSIFVRTTNSPMDQQSRSNRKGEVNNESRVTPHQPASVPTDAMTASPAKDRKPNGRLPLENMWTDVKRKRKILREKALKESLKRNQASKQQANGLDDHKPFVNDISEVTKLYTTLTIAAAQFKRPSIANSSTNSSGVTLNRREADIYRKMTKAYDDSTDRQKRQQIFYKRLGEIQDRTASQKRADMARMERERENAIKRQERQLKNLRERYNTDRMGRFSHQYVSHKVIDTESSDRHMYGLPEEYGETRSPDFMHRRKKNTEKPSRTDQKKKNMQAFGFLFPNRPKPLHKRPKMEGIDTLVISDTNENGEGTVERERQVRSVIKEAQDYLHRDPLFSDDELINNSNNDKLDGVSETDLDLDEDELFERARRKYQIDLDSEDEEDSVLKGSKFL